jgi:DNA-binding NtrC family response regulator
MLSIVLKQEGFSIDLAEDGRSFFKKIKKNRYDLIISDIKMPDINGMEILRKVKSVNPDLPVIMITAFASTNDAVEAMKYGAEDYIIKPFNIEELKILISKSLHRQDIENENVELKKRLAAQKDDFENIIGQNTRMLQIFELVDSIADTDSSVLVSGESGTGKELIARAIHNKSSRRGKPFVSINCGALPESILESELFGHERGAFTDAYKDKEGLFLIANNGTLFLDEIGEMAIQMQVKLLRAIQERKIRKVGSNVEQKINVRIISATNKELSDSIKNKEFRTDLFYRLNVIKIHLPPLRERKDDIESLIYHFMGKYNKQMNKSIKGFDANVIESFNLYNWPGNIRELENTVERAVALETRETIGLQSIPSEIAYSYSADLGYEHSRIDQLLNGENFDFNEYIDKISKDIIKEALKICNHKLNETAKKLQISYRSLRYYIDKFQLK